MQIYHISYKKAQLVKHFFVLLYFSSEKYLPILVMEIVFPAIVRIAMLCEKYY